MHSVEAACYVFVISEEITLNNTAPAPQKTITISPAIWFLRLLSLDPELA